MKWEIRKVYFYLVSLITFIMLLIGTWTFIMILLEFLMPGPPPDPCIQALHAGAKDLTAFTPERCEQLKALELERMVFERTRGVIANLLFLLMVGPAYWYHWRQARRSDSA